MLGDLLVELGQDTALMAGSNDGDVVPADTARAWGAAILDNLSRIRVVQYPDSTFAGGFRSELHVDQTDTPVTLSASRAAAVVVERLLSSLPAPEAAVEDPDAAPDVVPLSEHQPLHDFVVEFGRFLLDSGGFEQW